MHAFSFSAQSDGLVHPDYLALAVTFPLTASDDPRSLTATAPPHTAHPALLRDLLIPLSVILIPGCSNRGMMCEDTILSQELWESEILERFDIMLGLF